MKTDCTKASGTPWSPKPNASHQETPLNLARKWARCLLSTGTRYWHITSARSGAAVLCGGTAAIPPNDRCASGYFAADHIGRTDPSATSTKKKYLARGSHSRFAFSRGNQLANDSNYGLAASIWTADGAKAHRWQANRAASHGSTAGLCEICALHLRLNQAV